MAGISTPILSNITSNISNASGDPNLITQDELMQAIGNPDAREAFGNMAIDRTGAFLSGQATSAFTKVFSGQGDLLPESLSQNKIGGTVNNIANTAAHLTQLAALGTRLTSDVFLLTGTPFGDETGQSSDELLKDMIKDLIKYAIDRITADIIKYTQQAITKTLLLATTAPSKILASTITHFNENKLSYDEILELFLDKNKIYKTKFDKSTATKQNNIITSVTETINNALVKVNDISVKAAEYIKLATDYIEEGPDHLTAAFNDIYTDATQYAQDYLNIAYNYATTKVNKACDSLGKIAGMALAEEYNEYMKRQCEKIAQKERITTKSALSKSLAAKQTIILKIMGIFGF